MSDYTLTFPNCPCCGGSSSSSGSQGSKASSKSSASSSSSFCPANQRCMINWMQINNSSGTDLGGRKVIPWIAQPNGTYVAHYSRTLGGEMTFTLHPTSPQYITCTDNLNGIVARWDNTTPAPGCATWGQYTATSNNGMYWFDFQEAGITSSTGSPTTTIYVSNWFYDTQSFAPIHATQVTVSWDASYKPRSTSPTSVVVPFLDYTGYATLANPVTEPAGQIEFQTQFSGNGGSFANDTWLLVRYGCGEMTVAMWNIYGAQGAGCSSFLRKCGPSGSTLWSYCTNGSQFWKLPSPYTGSTVTVSW